MPLFSTKTQKGSDITLLKNDVVESDEGKVAEIMCNYIVYITKTIGILCPANEHSTNNLDEDPC